MKCIAAAVVGFIALVPLASAQDSKLNVALHACVAKAGLQRLPPMVDQDDPAALILGCEGEEAVALFGAMELVSNQSVEGEFSPLSESWQDVSCSGRICSSNHDGGLATPMVDSARSPGLAFPAIARHISADASRARRLAGIVAMAAKRSQSSACSR